MIMEPAQQKLKERFSLLPRELQEAILAADLREKLKVVTDTHRLHIDQAGALENETILVMLGLEPLEDYRANLARELGVPEALAAAIERDVNRLIFLPIRESLKNLTEKDAGEEGAPAPAAPSPAERAGVGPSAPAPAAARAAAPLPPKPPSVPEGEEPKPPAPPPFASGAPRRVWPTPPPPVTAAVIPPAKPPARVSVAPAPGARESSLAKPAAESKTSGFGNFLSEKLSRDVAMRRTEISIAPPAGEKGSRPDPYREPIE